MSALNPYAPAPGAQSGCEDKRVRSIERSKAGLLETLAAVGKLLEELGMRLKPVLCEAVPSPSELAAKVAPPAGGAAPLALELDGVTGELRAYESRLRDLLSRLET